MYTCQGSGSNTVFRFEGVNGNVASTINGHGNVKNLDYPNQSEPSLVRVSFLGRDHRQRHHKEVLVY